MAIQQILQVNYYLYDFDLTLPLRCSLLLTHSSPNPNSSPNSNPSPYPSPYHNSSPNINYSPTLILALTAMQTLTLTVYSSDHPSL